MTLALFAASRAKDKGFFIRLRRGRCRLCLCRVRPPIRQPMRYGSCAAAFRALRNTQGMRQCHVQSKRHVAWAVQQGFCARSSSRSARHSVQDRKAEKGGVAIPAHQEFGPARGACGEQAGNGDLLGGSSDLSIAGWEDWARNPKVGIAPKSAGRILPSRVWATIAGRSSWSGSGSGDWLGHSRPESIDFAKACCVEWHRCSPKYELVSPVPAISSPPPSDFRSMLPARSRMV